MVKQNEKCVLCLIYGGKELYTQLWIGIVYSVDIERSDQKETIPYEKRRIIVNSSVYDDGRNAGGMWFQ